MTTPPGRAHEDAGSGRAANSAVDENKEGSADGAYPSHESSGGHPSPTWTHVALDAGHASTKKVESDNDDRLTGLQTPAPMPAPTPLQRTATNGSFHAQASLRRMATHETGGYDHGDHPEDGGGRLDTHDETHEETSSDRHEESRVEGGEGAGDKEKKKAPVLQDQTNLLPVKQVIFVFLGLNCAVFCSLLDQTIVTTALPTLGRVFNRSDIAPWVGTAYLLTSTSLQPIYGRLSDIFGRKFVLLGSLFIFMIGSLACALAQSMIQLIVFRAIQGIGGGGILTLAMIIVSDVITLKERGKYQGIMGGVVALANSLGPIIGGLFTEKASWRWCFWINLPLTAISIVVIIFLLPLRRVKGGIMGKLKILDWYGSVLTIAWAVLFLLGLSWAGTQYPWASAAVLAPILIGLALLALFMFVEWRLVVLPLIPLRIFRNTTVAAAMLSTWFSGMSFYATLYYLPTYFQVVRGESPIRSGVLLLPLVTVQTASSFTSGLLVSKTGDYYYNLVIGFSIWSIGLGLLSTIDENTSLAKLVGYQIIDGIGAGQTFQTSLVAIQASVERKEMATATGLRNFLRMLGGTLALTICSTIVNNIVRTRVGNMGLTAAEADAVLSDPTRVYEIGLTAQQRLHITEAYAHGIRACFWFMAPCAAIGAVVTVFFIKRVSLKRDDDAQQKAAAEAWVNEKKAKKHGRKGSAGHHGPDGDAAAVPAAETRAEGGRETDADDGFLGRVEDSLEDAGRGVAEAGGLDPARDEGLKKGGVGQKAGR